MDVLPADGCPVPALVDRLASGPILPTAPENLVSPLALIARLVGTPGTELSVDLKATGPAPASNQALDLSVTAPA